MWAELVSGEWLADHISEVVIADVRWSLEGGSGREEYLAGHIPGAVFVDVDWHLSDLPSPARGRHPLPSTEKFAAYMSERGIGDNDFVVAYDDAGGSTAARLWWMLDVLGHRAAVLDGGLPAWPGELEPGAVTRRPVRFTPRLWSRGRCAGPREVDRLRGDPRGVILDARPPARYTGELEPIDPRPGHIPSARSAPWEGNLDPITGRFLPPLALRDRYARLGVDENSDIVVYCGSGVTACHDVLALRIAGLSARLYPGSWSQWSADPTRPIAIGADPG